MRTEITLNKGGLNERTVALESLIIPDLWHIAASRKDEEERKKILECWHLAHDLKKHLLGITAERDQLREALSLLLINLQCFDQDETTRSIMVQAHATLKGGAK